MIFQTLCTKLGKVWQSQTMTVKSPFAPALLILIQTECVERIYNKSTKKGGERKLPSKSSKHCKSKPQTANKLDVTLPTSTNSKELKIQILLGFKWIIHLYFLRTFGIVNFAFFNFQLYNHLKLEHRKQIRNIR